MWRLGRTEFLDIVFSIVFFLVMFWKLVFCKLQNMRWPSNVTWNIQQRCFVKMAKAKHHLWHPLTQCYKKGFPLIKNTTSQKWHPTWMASHKYIIGFLKYYQHPANRTYPTIRHRRVIEISLWSGKNSTFKSHDHEFES